MPKLILPLLCLSACVVLGINRERTMEPSANSLEIHEGTEQKSARRLEFSASTVENSAVLADFSGKLTRFSSPTTAETKTPTEQRMERLGFVDIQRIDSSIQVSLMYTRADNFTGRVLYTDLHHAYLHPEAAQALKKAQAELKRLRPDLSLKVYDAARPMSVQQRMYDVVKGTSKSIYVSNPKNGGGLHNYGLAVDLTLCDAKGDTLHMGTVIDHLGKLAHVKGEQQRLAAGQLSQTAIAHRKLLRRVMAAGGFKVLSTEWWHFNLRTRAEAKARYKVIP